MTNIRSKKNDDISSLSTSSPSFFSGCSNRNTTTTAVYFNNMYYMLSVMVWFLLCVGVVIKHHSLINIFYSFMISTVTAMLMVGVIMMMIIMTKNADSNTTTTTTVVRSSMLMLIGNTIGIFACTVQLALIVRYYYHLTTMNTTDTSDATSRVIFITSLPYTMILSTYSIAAGYLVFDHWYTFCLIHWLSRNCCSVSSTSKKVFQDSGPTSSTIATSTGSCTPCVSYYTSSNNNFVNHQSPFFYKSLYSIVEDTLTLIVILILLVQQQQQQQDTVLNNNIVNLHQGQNSWNIFVYGFLIWPTYKLYRLIMITLKLIFSLYANQKSISTTIPINITTSTTTMKIDCQEAQKSQKITTSDRKQVLLGEIKNHPTVQTNNNNIWRIYGMEYDLTNFVRYHPGGYEAIMLGCHRDDCTALFQSYHPSPKSYRNATNVLKSYRIHPPSVNIPNECNVQKIDSSITDQGNKKLSPSSSLPHKYDFDTIDRNNDVDGADEFYNLLCERVTKELWDRHRFHLVKDRTATPIRVVYYALVTIGVLTSAYNYGIRGSSILFGSIPFAIFGWLFGALGHDAGHYAVCRRYPIINDICVWAICLLCNPIVWQHQHTYGHHSHTNDVTHDPDLHHFTTLLRVHENFQHYGIYRYQKHPLYVFFAYMFVVFGTCIWIPWGIIQEGSLYGIVEWTDRHRPLRTIGMYTHLIAYITFIVIVPYFVYKTWYMAWLAVTTHISLTGIIFAIFSQINHLNEASLQRTINTIKNQVASNDENKAKTATKKVEDSWSIRQIEASNNFCPQSVLWYYVSNGLNLQIEHHLFPGINHCHLPKIQPIVREMCLEYAIPYKCYDSWSDIMMATLDWLNRLSKIPNNCKYILRSNRST